MTATTTEVRVRECMAWLREFYDHGDQGSVRLAELPVGGEWAEHRTNLGTLQHSGRTFDDVAEALARALVADSAAGHLFACPYLHIGGRRQGEAVARRHVHADMDAALDLDAVRALGGMAVASGSLDDDGQPRGHVYLRLSASVSAAEHRALCIGLGATLGGEAAGWDRSKTADHDVLRPAGTLNHKGATPRLVAWLIGPDDDGVRTWEPAELAACLGVDLAAAGERGQGAQAGEDGPTEAEGEPEDHHGDTGTAARLRARVAALAARVTAAEPRAGNNTLNWAAHTAARAWLATDAGERPAEAEVQGELMAGWLARPVPEGERAEAREREGRATIGSGWRAGLADGPDAAPAPSSGTERDQGAPVAPSPSSAPATGSTAADDADDADADDGGAEADVREGTGRVDLSELLRSGRLPEPTPPEVLHRTDGAALFYRRSVNRVFGDYESGKTWVLLAAAAEVLADGGRVAHLDVDHMGAAELVRRMGNLGVGVDVLGDAERFRLYEPGEGSELRAAVAEVAEWAPEFVGLDSVGEVMPLLGLSSNSPDEYKMAHAAVIQPLADAGACTVIVDHLGKGDDARRRGPSGALAKGQPLRGVSLRVRVARPFVPGEGGQARLEVEKDTRGGVRAAAYSQGKGAPCAGLFTLTPAEGATEARGGADAVDWTITPATGGALAAALDMAGRWQHVRELLETLEVPETVGQVQAWQAVRAHRDQVADTAEALPEFVTSRFVHDVQKKRKHDAEGGQEGTA